MIFSKQLNLHQPKEGIIGDCWRTAIACLMDKLPEEVPHFLEPYWREPDATNALRDIREWLATYGLGYVEVPFGACELDHMLHCMNLWGDSAPMLLSGTSKNGTNHIVIVKDGKIIWDPARDDSGIVGPTDTGYWFVGLITKLS